MPALQRINEMNACFNFIETHSTPVAIKAFILTTFYNLIRQYPIQNKLTTIIEDLPDKESSAFVSRGKKILRQLHKCKKPGIHRQRDKKTSHNGNHTRKSCQQTGSTGYAYKD